MATPPAKDLRSCGESLLLQGGPVKGGKVTLHRSHYGSGDVGQPWRVFGALAGSRFDQPERDVASFRTCRAGRDGSGLPTFAAATGLRPEEWQALERRDLDRRERVLNVSRTVSSGEVVDLSKTAGSRRQVPLSRRALDALDALPARLDTPLLFPSKRGKLLDLDHFRLRQWSPAIEASGVRRPARIYDLRSTFASDALAAGASTYELARIMGTSGRMIERHYGKLLDGAMESIATRLDLLDAKRDEGEGVAR